MGSLEALFGRLGLYTFKGLALFVGCLFLMAAIVVVAEPMPVTGMQDIPFTAGPVGSLVIISGPEKGALLTEQHNWMYFVFMCPDAPPDPDRHGGSDGISHDIMSIPKFTFDWPTNTGMLPIRLYWNQWLDRVSIHGQKRSRKEGNVFVVTISGEGAMTVQQCGSLGPKATRHDVLRQIQQKLPDNPLVASIVLPRGDD